MYNEGGRRGRRGRTEKKEVVEFACGRLLCQSRASQQKDRLDCERSVSTEKKKKKEA